MQVLDRIKTLQKPDSFESEYRKTESSVEVFLTYNGVCMEHLGLLQ